MEEAKGQLISNKMILRPFKLGSPANPGNAGNKAQTDATKVVLPYNIKL